MLASFPRDLINIICLFAYNASYKETLRSLDVILELKTNYIHPYIKASSVPDYARCTDGWYYDRVEMRPGLLAPFHQSIWQIFRVVCVLICDMDWRKTSWIRRDTGFRSRQSFLLWVATTAKGILYCSVMFTKLRLSMLKKHPTRLTRYLVSEHFDDWSYLI